MKTIITRTPVILLALLISFTGFGIERPAALAAGTPDLTIQGIALSPIEPPLDEQITITVTVKNQGDTSAGLSYITCYVDDSILDTKVINSIAAGLMATAVFNWKATGGTHTIKAITDSNQLIPESDETNNSYTYSFTTLAADLIVDSITWSPANPSKGDSVTFSVKIKNQGNYESHFTSIDFLIDGRSRGVYDIPVIKPGDSITKTYSWSAAPERHTLKAVADVAGLVKESDKANNELTVIFDTLPPDLIVQKITWLPEIPSKDDTVQFTVTITNQGTGQASATHLGYYIDDMFLDSLTVPVLNSGASCDVQFSWKATLNAHNIRAVIDYYRIITESNEENNELTSSLTAQPPDLIISNLTWVPAEPAAGDTVTITAALTNRGGGAAEASRSILYIGGKHIGYVNFPAVAAGATQTANLIWTAESGSHAVSITADLENKIIETKEDNNRYDTTLPVQPPDLIVTGIFFTPEKPAMDENVTFTIVVKNQGKGRASNFNVACYVDDIGETIKNYSALASGASANTTYTWKIRGGHHVFKAYADYDCNILETDEKNNIYSVPVAADMPDLSITNVTWSPAEITAGQETIFTIDVKNVGTLEAGASRLVFYVDGALAGFNDIDSLDADAKISQTFTWPAAEGEHTIKIVADSKAQINEIDEANNTVVVNIPAPDLSVQEISYSTMDVMAGDKVIVTATVMNGRGSPTQNAMITCYVDGASIGANELPSIKGGDTYRSTFEWIATPGAHTFKVRADTNNTVIETDETNNEKESLFATTTPDILVENVAWQTSGAVSNEINFTVTLKNAGGCDSGPFSLDYSFNNLPKTSRDIASIPSGGTTDVIFTSILPEGMHTLNIDLDTGKKISEIDEANNEYKMSFSTTTPDLSIRSVTWAPLTANIGDAITITVKIENRGYSTAAGTRLSLTIDGADAGFTDIPEIASGATVSIDMPWTAIEGEHQILVLADSAQTITESNEENNSRSRTITFFKPEAPPKNTPVINPAATTGDSLLDSWWWLLLAAGGLIGIAMLYSTIKGMRKK